MSRRTGSSIIAVLVIALLGASHPGIVFAARKGIPEIRSLSFDVAGEVVVVRLGTSAPAPAFTLRATPGSQEIILEWGEATSRLQARYTLDGAVLREAHVDSGSAGGRGVRLRLTLGSGALSLLEQTEEGVVLHFVRLAAPSVVGEAGDDPASPENRAGIGDKIDVTVYDNPDLTKTIEVMGDGTIDLPPIGRLPVAGKTAEQIDDAITQALGKGILRDPQVTVAVTQLVTLVGEVRNPGRYPLRRDMRLIDLLAEGGWTTKEAGSDIVITRRQDGGRTQQIVVDRGQLLSRDSNEANIPLRRGDLIAVAEKQVFYIRGEVARPGSYFLETGMTILKAVSVAGGFTQFAKRSKVELLHAGPGGVQTKELVDLNAIENGRSQDVPLRGNDTVNVLRRVF